MEGVSRNDEASMMKCQGGEERVDLALQWRRAVVNRIQIFFEIGCFPCYTIIWTKKNKMFLNF